MAANADGIVFRRLAGVAERRRAARLLAGCGSGHDGEWYALCDLTAAEECGLAGVAVVRPIDSATVELCGMAVSAGYRGRGLGRRLIGEVADRLRASGVERLVARPAPDRHLAALLRAAGFAVREDGRGWLLVPL